MKISIRLFALIIMMLVLAACLGDKTTQTPTQAETSTTSAPTAVSGSTPEPTAVVKAPWWNEDVFYEVFVRSFRDSNGDGKGDINGLIEKLDYLNDGDPATTTDLGITGIWLMPINESPSYHGYDVVDYYAVEKDLGTAEDFKRLIEEAHKRGIKVIIDMVLNHTSSQNPWFLASKAGDPKYRDWYIWSDTDPGYKGPLGQQVWYKYENAYYYAVFWSEMPDLNLKNPEVTAEVDKIINFWLTDMKVDGFRLDGIKHYVEEGSKQENTAETHTWLQTFHQYYKTINPQAFTVGEAWTDTKNVVDYTGDEVDIAFQFDLAEAFLNAANGPLADGLIYQWKVILKDFPENQFGVFLTNHDQNRVMSQLREVEDARIAATMLLTAPGVPFIYYGEEIGMTGVKPDEHIRRPMQWSGANSSAGFSSSTPWAPPAADYKEVNVELQTDDPDSLLSHYRNLINIRNQHVALKSGDTIFLDTGQKSLYAMLRYNGQEALLVLLNVRARAISAEEYSLSLDKGPFNGALKAVSLLGLPDPVTPEINASGGFSNYIPFQEIPAKASIIIQLTP